MVIADTANGPSLEIAAADIEALRIVLEPAAVAGTAATIDLPPRAALTGSTTDAAGSGPHARTVAGSLSKLFRGPPPISPTSMPVPATR